MIITTTFACEKNSIINGNKKQTITKAQSNKVELLNSSIWDGILVYRVVKNQGEAVVGYETSEHVSRTLIDSWIPPGNKMILEMMSWNVPG